jgi:protein-tyrosine phosphatase/CheY-like chemotaxis protein
VDFQYRLVNRTTYPQKHILVCEDVMTNQSRILDHLSKILDPEGIVQISVVSGGVAAAAVISSLKIDLILLDHDMPQGNGTDLINWMKKNNHKIPIIAFSGIPYNNQHMGNLGVPYPWWTKQEIIDGVADDLIRGLTAFKPSIAELYSNTICNNYFAHRWWAHPEILVGGSVIDADDFNHLKNDYGIQSVINVESEHSNEGKGIDNLCEARVPDNGTPFPKEAVVSVVKFAKKALLKGKVYVHCQMGSSRSPAFAYAILRHCFNMSKDEALEQVAAARPDHKKYGYHQYHQNYLNSVEEALSTIRDESLNVGIAEHYTNTISPNNIVLPRYWVTPNILVGGNIIDHNDWEHLKKDFGIVGVINVDGLSDKDKGIDNLLECPVPDNGNAFPKEYILQAIDFIAKNDGPIYIHCHLGFSRSPHFTYAVLRGAYSMSQGDALFKVKAALPSPNHHWGFNQHTEHYIKSIEEALQVT